ncbi:MAG: response regulator transcription factor [Thermodesulfobacteriota bacterium]|nr:response regulator transcription factor [Thermodesulfobacteriota bacterium]
MRLLVVEDDKKIASFLEKGLRESGFSVDVCHDGIDGLSLALTEPYEAAVIDIMLPGLDGLDLIEKIRTRGVTIPVLILSARQSVDDRIEGLQRGGDDYMVKPFSFNELLARIQALLRRGRKVIHSGVISVGELQLDPLKREVRRQGEKIELPTKEYALLDLMMRNPGRVLSKTSILEQIYEYNFDPQTNVIDVLVCRLRNRIDKEYDNKLIHTVRGMGYVLRTE